MKNSHETYFLYGHPRSGNAYKTALLLSMTNTIYEFIAVDLPNGGNLNQDFLDVNPLGKIPVLKHGNIILRQSHDILRYVSEKTEKFGPKGWEEESRIGDWVGYSVDFMSYGIARLRFERLFGNSDQSILEYFKVTADRGLKIIELHLAKNQWLACARPTIADISVYPVMTYLEDAGYYTTDFPYINEWMNRFQSLPGFAKQLELMPAKGWPTTKQ